MSVPMPSSPRRAYALEDDYEIELALLRERLDEKGVKRRPVRG